MSEVQASTQGSLGSLQSQDDQTSQSRSQAENRDELRAFVWELIATEMGSRQLSEPPRALGSQG